MLLLAYKLTLEQKYISTGRARRAPRAAKTGRVARAQMVGRTRCAEGARRTAMAARALGQK